MPDMNLTDQLSSHKITRHNNNNNNLTCKAPVCAKKTSVAQNENDGHEINGHEIGGKNFIFVIYFILFIYFH